LDSTRYQPLEPIKPGAPFRARDLETAQTVLIHTLGGLEAAAAARILARADRVRGVFHPALITIFDVFEGGPGSLLAACEFVPAQTLQRALGGQPINSRRAMEIVAELADGVAELHARQFPHGAISSESVLQTDKGRTKLDLIHALSIDDGSEESDLQALELLLQSLGGGTAIALAASGSAAVAAARLREAARAP
jgi:eukaryotic-like serine/threonine-protein kinase